MVDECCDQDMNGDGIHAWPNDAGTWSFVQVDHPEVELAGATSEDERWLCGYAVVYSYGNKNQDETIRELASVGFHAEG